MKIHIAITTEDGKIYSGTADLAEIKNVHIDSAKILETDTTKPPYSIKQLYLKKFFEPSQKLGDVTKELKSGGYNFKPGSIQYALDNADYLERLGESGNYRWIQKFPPSK